MNEPNEITEALALLDNPSPDPDDLDGFVPTIEALQEKTAMHLVRAILTAEVGIPELKKRRDEETAAWNAMIAKRELWAKTARLIIQGWMERSGTTKLQHPYFTASIAKGRTRKVVLDEAKAIEIAEHVYPKAVKIVKQLVKAELDVAVDTFPGNFKDVVTEETGPDSLIIRNRG